MSSKVSVVRMAIGWIVLAVLIVAGFFAVQPYLKSGPQGVAAKFLSAVARRDLTAARQLLTESVGTVEDRHLEALLAAHSTFTLGELTDRGNYAIVQFTTPESTEPQQLQLEQVDGRWLVFGHGNGPFPVPNDPTLSLTDQAPSQPATQRP